MSDEDLIKAFMAKNGVKKITEGERTTTERQMYHKVRGLTPPRPVQETKPGLRVVIDHAGREFYMNEEGEWI